MPFLQPNSQTYFGFIPAGPCLSLNAYPVSSSEAAIFAGDVCLLTSISTVKPIAALSTGDKTIIGVAQNYVAANTGSTGQTGPFVYIYDHPDQVFCGTDTTSGGIGSTGAFKSYAVEATGAVGTTGVGNINTGISNMAIQAVSASSGGAMRHLGLHPIEQNLYATATGLMKRHLFKFTTHVFGNSAQPGAITT